MKAQEISLPLRIVLRNPLPGVRFAVQKGKASAAGEAELVFPTKSDGDSIYFDFPVRVDMSKRAAPRFLGDFTQGPPKERFVYVNSGKRAGQLGTGWDRRAKIPLTTIPSALVEAACDTPDAVVQIEIAGTGRDGGPICATVRQSSGWRLAPK